MYTLQGKYSTIALHVAVQCESIQIIQQLSQSNASPNKRGKFSRSPLHLGLYRCVEDIVETLIEHSADPFLGDGYGRSGLDWATFVRLSFKN